MPNDSLVDRVLALAADATASERLVLKLAAALIKQLDAENYDIRTDTDPRIRLSREEMDWLPDRFEVWNSIPMPKHWAPPEHMAALERENLEIAKLEEQFNADRQAAINEYLRRLGEGQRR